MIEKEIEYIAIIRNKLNKFDISFFSKKEKNIDIKKFIEKYNSISILLNKFDLLLKRNNETLLLKAIEQIKDEYIEYKYLKNNISKSLLKHKANIRKIKNVNFNRFGHENIGSVLSVSKENKNKR